MMLVVDISLAEPGMELLRDVKDSKGNLLAKKDEKLNEELIEKLKNSEARFLLIKTYPDEKDPGYVISSEQNGALKDKVYGIFEYLSLNNGLSKSFFYEFSDQLTAITESIFTVGDLLKEMKIIEFYDDYTYQHSVGVMVTSLLLAKKLEDNGVRKFTAKEKLSLALGALLHDIGKATINKEITNKPDKLTDEEFAEMKKHPIHGKVLIRRLRPALESAFGKSIDMNLVEQIVGCHHLRPDGKGYGVDPDVDVIPKKLERIHRSLSSSLFVEGNVKVTEKGNIIYENKGKQVSVYGKPSKGEKIVNETSLKTFVSGMENEMSRILAKNPFSSKTPVISDLVWIVGMADAYDAMVSDRSYRVGMHPVKVLKIIEEERGKQFFAPFVDSFKEIVVDYPIGSVVLFRDGCVGVVTEAEKDDGKCDIVASLFGDIEAIGKERKFASEDVFLGSRRIGDIEKELHKATGPLGGSRVVLAAKEELANFIYASLNPEIIEEALFKIRSKPVFEGSRKALEKVFEEDMDIGGS